MPSKWRTKRWYQSYCRTWGGGG